MPYSPAEGIIAHVSGAQALFDAVLAGAKAGASAIAKDVLTTLGQAVISQYAPELATLLFGGESEIEQATPWLHEMKISHATKTRKNTSQWCLRGESHPSAQPHQEATSGETQQSRNRALL